MPKRSMAGGGGAKRVGTGARAMTGCQILEWKNVASDLKKQSGAQIKVCGARSQPKGCVAFTEVVTRWGD